MVKMVNISVERLIFVSLGMMSFIIAITSIIVKGDLDFDNPTIAVMIFLNIGCLLFIIAILSKLAEINDFLKENKKND